MRSILTSATLMVLLAACGGESSPASITSILSAENEGRALSGTVSSLASDSLTAAGPVANAVVTVWAAVPRADSGSTYNLVGTTETDASGNFSFANVPAGALQIEAAPPTGSAYGHAYQQQPSGSSNISGVRLVLLATSSGGGVHPPTTDTTTVTPPAPNRTIQGTIVGVGTLVGADSGKVTGPVADVAITVSIWQAGVLTVVGNTTTDKSGHFVLANMPGAVVVLTVVPPSGAPFRNGTYFVYPTGTTSATLNVYLYPVGSD